MQKDPQLIEALCRPYCSYFKPDRNEELLCRGAMIVVGLQQAGRLTNHHENVALKQAREATEVLLERLCGACDFRAEDCDFARDPSARPCGGFILLTRLLAADMITAEELDAPRGKNKG